MQTPNLDPPIQIKIDVKALKEVIDSAKVVADDFQSSFHREKNDDRNSNVLLYPFQSSFHRGYSSHRLWQEQLYKFFFL